MQLLGLFKIEHFKIKHPDSRSSLNAWQKEAELATWNGPQDIKNRYPSASFLSQNLVIFNIKGNSHRLVVKVKYQNGIALIEWIGTHAEYDKKKF